MEISVHYSVRSRRSKAKLKEMLEPVVVVATAVKGVVTLTMVVTLFGLDHLKTELIRRLQ
jgi:hypothetical protein